MIDIQTFPVNIIASKVDVPASCLYKGWGVYDHEEAIAWAIGNALREVYWNPRTGEVYG